MKNIKCDKFPLHHVQTARKWYRNPRHVSNFQCRGRTFDKNIFIRLNLVREGIIDLE
jgi:hypothetical protein